MTFIEPSAILIKDLIATIGYPGLAFLMALDATILPVPSAVVMGFAGYLCYEGRLDIWSVTLFGALGSAVGSLSMYVLGRWGGRPFLDRYGKYLGLKEGNLKSADTWFMRFGDRAVFLCQLLPIARDIISLPAGVARMGVWRFTLMSILGSVPYCFLLALIGWAAGPAWGSAVEVVDQYDLLITVLILAPFITYGAFRLYRRRMGRPRERRQERTG
jgi:membrane protein DedA with SNARE-associated domain